MDVTTLTTHSPKQVNTMTDNLDDLIYGYARITAQTADDLRARAEQARAWADIAKEVAVESDWSNNLPVQRFLDDVIDRHENLKRLSESADETAEVARNMAIQKTLEMLHRDMEDYVSGKDISASEMLEQLHETIHWHGDMITP